MFLQTLAGPTPPVAAADQLPADTVAKEIALEEYKALRAEILATNWALAVLVVVAGVHNVKMFNAITSP